MPDSKARMTDFIRRFENTLGWVPQPAGRTLKSARNIEASKIMQAGLLNSKITVTNLELAMEYCRRRKLDVRTPYGLVFKIDEALKYAAEPESADPLGDQVQAAIAWEYEHEDSDTSYWFERLNRSQGRWRTETLTQWREAGRG